jgi:hypothetical protein
MFAEETFMTRRIGIVLCALLLVWSGYAVGQWGTPVQPAPAAVSLESRALYVESVRQSQLLLGIHATLVEIARRLPAPVSQDVQP